MIPTVAHQGAWADPEFPGQGIILFVVNGVQIFYYYGQNVDNDTERYWFGSSTTGIFPFYTTADPRSHRIKQLYPDVELHDAVKVGDCQIDMVDGKLIFRVLSTEHTYEPEMEFGRMTFVMNPVLLSQNPLCGAYRIPGNRNEGWTILLTDDFAAAWFFGQKTRPLSNDPRYYSKEVETQRWMMSIGALEGNTAALVTKRVRHSQLRKRGDQIAVDAYDSEDPRCQEFETDTATLRVEGESLYWNDELLERV